MPTTPAQDAPAKDSILEAAQRLFARDGFEKVSMRSLTQEAGVNLAAVNYHFRSKEGLIDAVISGYINPVNEARLQALDNAEAASGESPLQLDVILDCFMKPVLESVRKSDLSERLFFRLMGRCMNDRSLSSMPDSSLALFQQILTRFPKALQRTLPHLPEKDVLWRLHFTVGVLIHVLTHTDALLHLAGDRVSAVTPEEILTQVKDYCRPGLEAPCSTPSF